MEKSLTEEKNTAQENDGGPMTSQTIRHLLGQADESIKYFEFDEALKILEKVSMGLGSITQDPAYSACEMEFLLQRGRIFWSTGKWNKALTDFNQIFEMKNDVEDPRFVIEAHLLSGDILGSRGNYRGAVDTIQEGLLLAEKRDDHLQIASACYSLGRIYSRMGEASTGRKLIERARLITDEHGDIPGMKPIIAAINNQVGLGFFRQKELDKAFAQFQGAVDLLEEDNLSLERAESLRYLGITKSMQGEHKSALEYHSDALYIYQQTASRFGQAKVFNSIGQTCLALSRLNEAINFMEKAEKICREMEADAEAATIYGKLGNVYMIKEEYDKAERYFTKDLEMCKKFGNVRAMAFASSNLGECSIYLGKSQQAAEFLNQSLDLFGKVSDPINEQRVLLLLAKAQINNGKLDEAGSLITKLVDMIPAREKSNDAASLLMLRGVIERHKKNWPEASMLLNQSIDIFKSKGKSVLLAEAYYEYGLLSRGINDREGALTKFKEAFRIARDLGLQRQRERFFMIIERIDEREIVKMLIEEIE